MKLCFPLSYIINDCIVGVYGFRKARTVIWLRICYEFFVTLFLQFAILLPGADSWQSRDAMRRSTAPFPAYWDLVCRLPLWIDGQCVGDEQDESSFGRPSLHCEPSSALFGAGTDSIIFFPLAFGGILPWREIVLLYRGSGVVLKTAYEIVILPVTPEGGEKA